MDALLYALIYLVVVTLGCIAVLLALGHASDKYDHRRYKENDNASEG